MNPKLEELVRKHAEYLKGYDDEEMVKNGAVFIENTILENADEDIEEDELCKIASQTYQHIHTSLPLVGVQVCQAREDKDDDNKEKYSGFALRFSNATEADGKKTVAFKIEQFKEEPQERKLKVRWGKEVEEEMKWHLGPHDIDIKEELRDLIAYEVSAEITRMCNLKVHEIVEEEISWEYPSENPKNLNMENGKFQQEVFRTLYTSILSGSETIARKTKMGPGNTFMASPRAMVALQSLGEFEEVNPTDKEVIFQPVAMTGTLNGAKCVRDTFYYSDKDSDDDSVLIGYKGERPSEAGVILLLNSISFEGTGVKLKYAFAIDEQSKDFYSKVNASFKGD